MYDEFFDMIMDLDKTFREFKQYVPKVTNTKTVTSKNNPKTVTNESKKISPPWWTLYKKLSAFFAEDSLVKIQPVLDDNNANKTIYIDTPDSEKAIALANILKPVYNMGCITIKIIVRVTNGKNKTIVNKERNDSFYNNYLKALSTTPAVTDIKLVEDMFGTKYTVVEFKKKVVQFFNDDLTDFYGNWNGLYTDIANDIFSYNATIKYTVATNE